MISSQQGDRKRYFDIRRMANNQVRPHLDFIIHLFEDSIKIKVAAVYIDYRGVLPDDQVSFQQLVRVDIREHITRRMYSLMSALTNWNEIMASFYFILFDLFHLKKGVILIQG